MKVLTGSKAVIKVGDHTIDALRYGIVPDARTVIKEAKHAIVDILRCHARAGYIQVHVADSNGHEFVGWADPDVFWGGGQISVLGKFDPVEIV